MSEHLHDLARQIMSLTAPELIALNKLLTENGGEAIGVREPRKPPPESPGDKLAQGLPEDYWETAE